VATVDYSRGAGQALVAQGVNRVLMLTREIDFSVTNLADADDGKIFDLPALSVVKRVVVQVLRIENVAAGASLLGGIGTVSDDDSLLNSVDFGTLGYYHSGETDSNPVGAAAVAATAPEVGRCLANLDEVKIDDVLLSGEDLWLMGSGSDLELSKVRVSAMVEDWDFPASLI